MWKTELDEQTAPNLYHAVEDMAMVAQIPMPRVFIVDDPSGRMLLRRDLAPMLCGCYDRSSCGYES